MQRPLRSTLVPLIFGALTASSAHAWDFSRISVVAIDPHMPTTVYSGMCDGSGVLKSVDAGATWNVSGLTGSYVRFLAADPQTTSTLYAAAGGWDCGGTWVGPTEAGVYKSTDGGTTWTIIGLNGVFVTALAINPQNPRVLYAGTYGSGVLKSSDGGITWEGPSGPGPFTTQVITIDASNPSTIYAGVIFYSDDSFTYYGGLYKSIDGGTSWTPTQLAYGSFLGLAIDPQTPTTVYAGGIWDIDSQTSEKGIFKSADGGRTWTTTGWEPCCPVSVDPRRPNELYSWSVAGFYKSTDAAATWVRNTALNDRLASYGMSSYISTVTIGLLGSTPVLYVATDIGLLKSMDSAATWTSTGLSQQSLLASVTCGRWTVPSGTRISGTVTLARAAADDVTISLASSQPRVAGVPPTVTVRAGSTTATFGVSTYAVGENAMATVWATHDDATRSAQFIVTGTTSVAPLTINPPQAVGGNTCQRRSKIRQFRRLKIRQIDEGTSLRSSRPRDGRGGDARERTRHPAARAGSATAPCAAACGSCYRGW